MAAPAKRPKSKKAEVKKLIPRIKTFPWDSAAYLKTGADVAAYLEAVFEIGDPALVVDAFGIIARSNGMAKIAKATGLSRESLCKVFPADSNSQVAAVLKVMRALGLKLKVAA